MTQFSDLGLAEPVLRALTHEGYDKPTPIQAQAIPSLLQGKDLLGIAQTGTGKTAAFALPILDRLSKSTTRTPAKSCRVLVLAPTRELAAQIGESFRAYGRFLKLTVAVVVGGVSAGPQIKAITPGVDVLVATPGRLLDHVDSGKLRLDAVEVVVLDEADHMLDLGFLPPIKRIVKMLPKSRQNLFFSATMPTQIGQLAGDMLRDPVKVSVTPVATTAERVSQSVYFIESSRKRNLLSELLDAPEFARTLVFTRTKRGADRVARHLESCKISAAAIHGNKSQNQRERALAAFKDGQTRVLVATDIAARGIDVDGVTHVVNYELPNVPESYVHRIGRTARAGAVGTAIAFCADDERGLLKDIERTTRQSIPSIDRRDAKEAAAQEAIAAETRPSGRGRDNRGDTAGRNGRNGGGRNQNSRSGQRPAASGGNRTAEGRDASTGSANQAAAASRYKGGLKRNDAAAAQQRDTTRRDAPRDQDGGNGGAVFGNGNGKSNARPNGDRPARSNGNAGQNGNRNNAASEGQNKIASNVAFLGKAGGNGRKSGNSAGSAGGNAARTGKAPGSAGNDRRRASTGNRTGRSVA
ncbi:MAG: DEAD/DEAH box helicase [Pseudomonadota bacterium]